MHEIEPILSASSTVMKWNPNQLLRIMLTFDLFPTIQNQHFCTHSFICPLDILMCSQWPTNSLCFIFTTLFQYISIPVMSFCICSWVLINFFYVCLIFFWIGFHLKIPFQDMYLRPHVGMFSTGQWMWELDLVFPVSLQIHFL